MPAWGLPRQPDRRPRRQAARRHRHRRHRAADIADFPDLNLADSIQRVPGVAIDRDAGEGRSITVRGLGSDFTRTRINSMEAQATAGGTDSSGGANRGRGFDFNVFASELFSRITVRKTAAAVSQALGYTGT